MGAVHSLDAPGPQAGAVPWGFSTHGSRVLLLSRLLEGGCLNTEARPC